MKRAASAVAIVASSGLATLVALQPIYRALTKLGGEAPRIATFVFWHQSLGCLIVGLIFAGIGATYIDRRRTLAIVLLVAAPIVAMLADFLILSISPGRP